ncbi:MAG: HesA/MoeB/ThiF family protein [Oligoflexia bacterium]|nr:HesA/MoeB/ThiF family protein [Oligoflexia bacterium]
MEEVTGLAFDEKRYYKRQLSFPMIGEEGQNKLRSSKILVVGAGGLGSPLLMYLVGLGIGEIVVFDFDKIEYENLHRQILFNVDEIGEYKALIAIKKLQKYNPWVKISGYTEKIDEKNIEEILSKRFFAFDLIIDCSDNLATRFLIHDNAYKFHINLLSVAIDHLSGSLLFFNFVDSADSKTGEEGCLRCLWPNSQNSQILALDENKNFRGILNIVPGMIATMAVMEIAKFLLKWEGSLKQAENFLIDLTNFETNRVRWNKKKDCSLCGSLNSQDKKQK